MKSAAICVLLQAISWPTAPVATAQQAPLLDSAPLVQTQQKPRAPQTPDTIRLKLFSQVIKYYPDRNVVLATRFAEQGEQLAHRLNQPTNEGYFLRVLSSMANQASNDRAAIAANKQLLALGPRLPVEGQWVVREAYKDLTEIVQLYQNAATAANVQLTTDAPPNLLLTAAPDMTRTILRNLTGNALKATPPGDRVVLRALPTPTSAKFRGWIRGATSPPGSSRS